VTNGNPTPPGGLRSDTPEGPASFKVPILIVLIAALLIGGWLLLRHRSTSEQGSGSNSGGGARDVAALRLHGSNTIGATLAPALAVAYLKSLGATNIQTKLLDKNESDVQGDVPGESKPLVIEIFAHGSKTAFVDLAAKKCDIGMASRMIEAKELDATSALGDLTSRSSQHVLGLDGVAVIVNRNNPVSGLTKDQLARIFSGQIKDWVDVGGSRGPIHILARDDNSGTFETFKTLVLKDKPLAQGAVRVEDSTDLSTRVSRDDQAIGFIGLPYILNAKAVAVSETEKHGEQESRTTPLYPNRLTVQTEDYPLSRRLFFYTPPTSTNLWAQKFVDFALSKVGQDVVGDNGFVSQTPIAVAPECTQCPARYRQLTKEKKRMTTNFHFQTGKSTLEDKALLDVSRVADVLADLKYSGTGVVLLGFADSVGCSGSSDPCIKLSKARAEVVAQEFRMHGVTPEVVDGMGSEMPVASNDDPAGREKNRRVEIWINR
jgi:phosphate transport system substrate-binding protein